MAEGKTSAEDAALVTLSLESAGQRAGDLTGDVYARLFAAYPETEGLFVLDRDGQVRGAMLSHVFETIFDFIGERRYAHRFVSAEIVTHNGYGVTPEAFAAFFQLLRDEVRTACASDWTSGMESAWERLLADLSDYVASPP